MMLQRILITALVSYFLGNHNGAICVSAMPFCSICWS